MSLEVPAWPGVESLTAEEFRILSSVARTVGTTPRALMTVIAFETMGTFSPSVVNVGCFKRTKNADKCATGLIQFMPDTARALGTTVADIARMSVEDQAEFVEDFFEMVIPRHRREGRTDIDAGDLYLYVFAPGFAEASDETVVFAKGDARYDQNAGLDRNQDGTIRAGELRDFMNSRAFPVGRVVLSPKEPGAVVFSDEDVREGGEPPRGGRTPKPDVDTNGLLLDVLPFAIAGAVAFASWKARHG